jgi:hypothetical protein
VGSADMKTEKTSKAITISKSKIRQDRITSGFFPSYLSIVRLPA